MTAACYQCPVLAKAKDVLSEEDQADVNSREACRNMIKYCEAQDPELEVRLEEKEYAFGLREVQ